MQEPRQSEIMSFKYPRGLHTPAFEFDGKSLYIQDGLDAVMGAHVLATWGSKTEAIIDGRAFDLLRKACGSDRNRLESYLRAITDFEIHHSKDKARHENRTPIEQEILDVLKEEGYFD